MKFAEEIRDLRRKCLLSQVDFAKEIGVSFSTVNRWETGKSKPNYKALKRIDEYCIIIWWFRSAFMAFIQ